MLRKKLQLLIAEQRILQRDRFSEQKLLFRKQRMGDFFFFFLGGGGGAEIRGRKEKRLLSSGYGGAFAERLESERETLLFGNEEDSKK